MPENHKLDNPVWFSLSETHQQLVIEYPHVKFYHPDYCLFGAVENRSHGESYIKQCGLKTDNFFIVGEKPMLPEQMKIKKQLVCDQMIIDRKIDREIKDQVIALKTAVQLDALFRLVNLVQPGYFGKKTALLGDYFGIYEQEELVAVTGERMKMNDFTEVSAVVTHPAYLGRGYASQLLAYTVNNILRQHKTPYLHVVEDNTRAIGLYEKSGFKLRRKISFWNIIAVGQVSSGDE